MRKFSRHITISGAGQTGVHGPEHYESTVEHLLKQIQHSGTGAAVFGEIDRRAHKKLQIIPLDGIFNAYAKATDYQHATPNGVPERSGVDGSLITDAAGHNINGLGGGSDAVLKFTASTWVKYCKTGHVGHKNGAQPDEVLFHEMVHGAREMRGLFSPQPLGHMYNTVEEFFAILVANIYSSETGRNIDLRSDHHDFTPLSHNQDSGTKFLPTKDPTNYKYELVEQFVRQESSLAQSLRHVHASFNPIRRYFELQTKPRATRARSPFAQLTH